MRCAPCAPLPAPVHAFMRGRRPVVGLFGDAADAARVASGARRDGAFVALVERVLRGETTVLERALRELLPAAGWRRSPGAPARARADPESSGSPDPSGAACRCGAPRPRDIDARRPGRGSICPLRQDRSDRHLAEGRQLAARPPGGKPPPPPRSGATCAGRSACWKARPRGRSRDRNRAACAGERRERGVHRQRLGLLERNPSRATASSSGCS